MKNYQSVKTINLKCCAAILFVLATTCIQLTAQQPVANAAPGDTGFMDSKSTLSTRVFGESQKVQVLFEWTGPALAYPPQGTPEELKSVLPVVKWFEGAGPQLRGDTYPMTLADDDEIYASAGDPNWGGKEDGLDVQKFSGIPPYYSICRVNPMSDFTGLAANDTA